VINQEGATWFADKFSQIVSRVEQAILGKREVVDLALTCLLSEGHLLLQDVPGTGKTMLAKALANTVQGSQKRIQFTPDLLPGDLTGVPIYDQDQHKWVFHPGPIFATIVLADEINRASPKTQSALLEVMEENHVTVDGTAHPVGPPFMVIATQNPVEQAGTYPLPEAQLDRFLMRTALGYPDRSTSVTLLADAGNRNRSASITPVITERGVVEMSGLAAGVHTEPSLLGYISDLVQATRDHPDTSLGVSMRGALAFVRAAKTWALAQGRPYIIPVDIKHLAKPVLAHRVLLTPEAEFSGLTSERVIEQILAEVAPPTERAA
jgi:MoxR-like ATPase